MAAQEPRRLVALPAGLPALGVARCFGGSKGATCFALHGFFLMVLTCFNVFFDGFEWFFREIPGGVVLK